jgi:peptide/nickel transport system substrate-binding protein
VGYRVWLTLAGLVVGAAVLASGGLSARAPKGGTLRIGIVREFDSLDPALAYLPNSWGLEYATCAQLYNYPDKPAPQGAVALPEVATSFPKVSANGKTQTIRLRHTFRFSNGQRVTARNFVAAFNRDASPNLQSPAVVYLHEIVGANAVINGKARTISGVKALGAYTLRVETTQPLPDLVSQLAMPFFCPIATDTPLQEIDDPLGSGPYYVASHVPNRETILGRNPYYRGARPANVDEVVWTIGLARETCRAAVQLNQVDYCGLTPPDDLRQTSNTYGINRPGGQFFVNSTLAMSYFAFNHDRRAFKGRGQIPLAKAINWAIDRPALDRAAGYLSGRRTDQFLPPAMTRPASIYPLEGVSERSLAKARALLRQARFKPKTLVFYTDNLVPANLPWAQIFQFNLRRLGIDVQIRVFPRQTFLDLAGRRGQPFDVTIQSWVADYPDGNAYFRPLVSGSSIASTGNTNVAYFDVPKYNAAIRRIESMSGAARRRAWASLDVEMMRDDPPYAPITVSTSRDFVSRSFGCFVLQPVFAFPDLAAACKK